MFEILAIIALMILVIVVYLVGMDAAMSKFFTGTFRNMYTLELIDNLRKR